MNNIDMFDSLKVGQVVTVLTEESGVQIAITGSVETFALVRGDGVKVKLSGHPTFYKARDIVWYPRTRERIENAVSNHFGELNDQKSLTGYY